MQKLIEQDHHKTGEDELDDEEKADTGTKIAWLAIKTRKDENAGLAEREDDSEEFLGGLVQFAVGLEVKVDVDEMGSREELSIVRFMSFASIWLSVPGKPCLRK